MAKRLKFREKPAAFRHCQKGFAQFGLAYTLVGALTGWQCFRQLGPVPGNLYLV